MYTQRKKKKRKKKTIETNFLLSILPICPIDETNIQKFYNILKFISVSTQTEDYTKLHIPTRDVY